MVSAMGRYRLGFAFGAANLIAAGTAIYDALAARIANNNLFPSPSTKVPLNQVTKLPFIIGIIIANAVANHPFFKKKESFCPLVIPISSKKTAKNPLKMSVVKGLIPSA